MKLSIVLAAFLVAATATAQEPALFPAGYPDHDALTAALGRVATEHPEIVRVRSIAKTAQGRDVWMATLGKPSGQKPAILIIANLEADHVVGSSVALAFVEKIAAMAEGADPKFPLDGLTIHVVPRLNPDGAELVLRGASPTSARISHRLNLSPLDRDRDTKTSEDGPDDVDGDGFSTRMRIKDAKAAYIPDEKDSRLLRKADPAKGERGVVSEYGEGTDNDGDGTINEDPLGGVNLNRHWPYNWTEFDPEAGFSPCSEPECRGLIEFAFAHPEIAAVWTFTLQDTLKSEPKKPGSTLDDADLPLIAELSRRFNAVVKVEPPAASAEPSRVPAGPALPDRKATVLRAKGRRPTVATSPLPPSFDGTSDGAMSEWAYHQFGVLGLSSRIWATPEIPEPAKGQPAVPGDGDARWLYWNDRVMGGRAFVPFRPVEHPELGPVEIGGWKPGVRVNPPFERVAPIAEAHLAFLKDLAGRLPKLEIKDTKAESKGAGVFLITATVTNEGFLPTALAQGVKTRTSPPVLIKLKGEGLKLLSGKPNERLETLGGSGGKQDYRWLVLVPEGTKSVTIEAACPKGGRAEKTVELSK